MIPIPGFRSRTPWKMVLASFVYALVLMVIVIAVINPTSPDSSVEPQKITQAQIDDFTSWHNDIMSIYKAADNAEK